MPNRIQTAIVVLVLAQGLAACGGSRSSIPSAPSPVAPPTPQPAPPSSSSNDLLVFREEASGFSTSDLRDAQDQIVQFNTTGELIWTADGTRLSGYRPEGNAIPAEAACQCWLVVHFGTSNGERRAYLTADYNHDNPGTLVDLEIAGGVLVVSRTESYPPGTYTLSGVVTEMTATGRTPIEGAGVWRLNDEESGWRVGLTDEHGFYEIHGLYDGSRPVATIKSGYETVKGVAPVKGDTRFDVQLVRR